MPSKLKDDAKCPVCKKDLVYVDWTQTPKVIKAEFLHAEKNSKTCILIMTHEKGKLLRSKLDA